MDELDEGIKDEELKDGCEPQSETTDEANADEADTDETIIDETNANETDANETKTDETIINELSADEVADDTQHWKDVISRMTRQLPGQRAVRHMRSMARIAWRANAIFGIVAGSLLLATSAKMERVYALSPDYELNITSYLIGGLAWIIFMGLRFTVIQARSEDAVTEEIIRVQRHPSGEADDLQTALDLTTIPHRILHWMTAWALLLSDTVMLLGATAMASHPWGTMHFVVISPIANVILAVSVLIPDFLLVIMSMHGEADKEIWKFMRSPKVILSFAAVATLVACSLI